MPGMRIKSKGRVRGIVYVATLACLLIMGIASVTNAASGSKDGWRLMVRSAACVQGPTVLLGEIADPVQGVDQRTWETISRIKLWKASKKPGRPVVITREKLSKVLRYYMGENVDRLVLPPQLTVQTGGKVILGQDLRERVVAFLTPRARDLGGEIELKDLDLPSQYFFRNVTDKLVIGLHGDIRPGRNQIKLRSENTQGRVVSGKAGTVFINVWKAVPVAAKPLNRFERVSKDKIGFRRVNLAYRPNLWDGTGGPWRMVRTLGRGQPFTLSHLEQIPLIEKGERVSLIFRGKRIQLSIKAEALGEASMGQQVAVRNLQSKKTVLATVIGDNLVMVR